MIDDTSTAQGSSQERRRVSIPGMETPSFSQPATSGRPPRAGRGWTLLVPIVAAVGVAVWQASEAHLTAAAVAVAVALAGVGALILARPPAPVSGTRTVLFARDPALLDRKRAAIAAELSLLEDAQDLQRSVFEVSAELVGCVEEIDARVRFTAAMRRYWACSAADLMVWERGTWRSLGGPAMGEAPTLAAPVQLPQEAAGDLVLDLSPGVAGQAVLVLRGATVQPSLDGRSLADQRYVAEVLRTQLALSLRRVILYGDLQSLARQDPLTGTHRRWYGETRLRELVEAGEVVAVAMVDIDLFKRVNDEFGHAAGDQVLAAVGRQLVAQLRTGDLVCRYGGEEFLVILPDTPPPAAALVVDRLRAGIAALRGLPRAVTVSIGLAACLQDETVEGLVQRADEALYLAKQGGRDRVVEASDAVGDSRLRTTARRSRKPAIGSDTSVQRVLSADAEGVAKRRE